MALFPTNSEQIQQFAGALYGIQVGSTTMAQVNQDINAAGGLNNALNGYYAASFGSVASSVIARSMVTNLGLTGTAASEGAAYIAASLTSAAPSVRGAVINSILNLFAGLTTDATYGAAATAWNTKVAASAAYVGTGDVAIGTTPANAGTAFTLTSSTDNITGTVGDDTFNATLDAVTAATADTLTAFDSINGGEGIDTLIIDGLSTAISAGTLSGLGLSASSIEILKVNNTAATSLNAADIGGTVTKVILNGTTAAQSITLADAVTEVSAKTTAAVTISGNAGVDVLKTVSLDSVAAASTIASDKLTTLNLINVSNTVTNTAAAATRILTINALNASGSAAVLDATATTFNVNASGTTANQLALTATAATEINVNATNTKGTTLTATNFTAAKTLNATGTGDLTVDVSGVAGLTKVDASTSTGKNGLTIAATAITVNGGTAADTITQVASLGATQKIATGAGDDSVVLGGALTAGATIDGGEGTDNLTLTSAVATSTTNDVQELVFSNFEQITISNALGSALNMANLDDIQRIVLAADAGTNAINGLTTGATVTYKAANTGTNTLTLTGAVAGAADVLNLVINTDGSTAAGIVVAADVETININSTDSGTSASNVAAAVDTLTLQATSATNIVVTGRNGINLTNTGNTKVTSFDASAVAGDNSADTAANLAVTFASANTTTSVTIKGGAGSDNLTGNTGTDMIDGGAGNDSIDGGAGADSLMGGAGDDIITGGTGNDAIDGGAGNDTINTGLGADAITLGTGTDTVAFNLASAVTAVSTIADFDAGTSTTAVDKISVTVTGAAWAAAATVKQSSASGAVDAEFIVLDGGTYSSLADAAAAADNIQHNAAVKNYLFAWTDAFNVVHISQGLQDAIAEVAVDQYVDLVKLTGVSLSNLDASDFTFA
jgi:S-layer protein